MRLAHTVFGGQGRPLLILHGLFGSSKNWASVGRHLAGYCRPFALDLRNHGQSPRSPSHSLEDLVGDLEQWVRENLGEPPVLLGHSMGGLAAMGYALRHPTQVRALAVVDIAPRAYNHGYEAEFRALRLDLSAYRSRGEVDRALAALLPDERTREFFQTSLATGPMGFRWTVNGPALEQSSLLRGQEPAFAGRYEGPTLLVKGDSSGFVGEPDVGRMRELFPALRVLTIAGADHWVHASAPQAFREAITAFLGELAGAERGPG
jgi:pimeloyl-ACP methyl ester carboxylesterase